MLFPVSGVDVPVFVPPLAAFIVSFFCSMGGVSGAFLLLPFQMTFLGYTSPSVSATNQFYNVVAIPGGVIRYVREGRMVWPLAAVVAAGTLPGVFLGALARLVWLPDAASFRIFAACFLFWIGAKLFLGVISGKRKEKAPGGERVDGVSWSLSRVSYAYRGRAYSCPTVPLFLVSLAVGAAGGAYGIGGGSIMAPLLVSVYGLPVHTTGGATLMGTFLTSVAGVIFYSVLAPFFPGQTVAPDFLLGLLFGAGHQDSALPHHRRGHCPFSSGCPWLIFSGRSLKQRKGGSGCVPVPPFWYREENFRNPAASERCCRRPFCRRLRACRSRWSDPDRLSDAF